MAIDIPSSDEWIDLTLRIDESSIENAKSAQISGESVPIHVGTHVDAPAHRIANGKSIDQYSLDRWITKGVVIDVESDPLESIRLSGLDPTLTRSDIDGANAVILRTGWEHFIDDELYDEHPYFSTELTNWLLEKNVSWVGMDFRSPDKPSVIRDGDFDFPAHRSLLADDVLIVENMTNLEPVSEQVVDLVALPMPIVGADGAPMRVVAKPVHE